MNMEEQNMDKAIREKLEGFSQQPPLHVWDNIQGRLQAQKRKRRIVVFSRVAAAAVVVLAFLAGWFFNEKATRITPVVTKTEIQKEPNSAENIEGGKTIPEAKNETMVAETKDNDENKPGSETEKVMETLIAEKGIGVFTANADAVQSSSEKETPEPETRENVHFKILDKIGVIFTQNQQEDLGLKEETIPGNQINRADEVLIAENIRNMANNEEDQSKWKVGLQVSPGYSSQNSSYSDAYSSAMTYSGENGNTNIAGGFSVQMKAGKKWSVESGVYYASNGQRSTNSKEFRADAMYGGYFPISESERSYFNTAVNLANGQLAMNSTAGVIQFSKTPAGTEVGAGLEDEGLANAPTLLTESEFSQVLEFIEVPLYLRYSLIDAKIGVELLGGINAGIVAGNKVYMENRYGNQNIGKTKDISTVNLSGTLGVGLNYAVSKHISLAVEPRFNYYLNSVNQSPEVNFRPYRIGVYTGLYYAF